jgi:aryl carrier-like protein
MAVNTEVPEELKRWQAESLKRGIRTHDGMVAFERILGFEGSQVLTSTSDLLFRIQQATQLRPTSAAPEPAKSSTASHPRPQLSTEYVAPRTRTETIIAGMWEELLGIQQIGVHDSFLELGGHSLLAIQLISRVRDTLHYELSVRELFATPTIAAIAALIDGEAPDQTSVSDFPALTRVPREQYRGRISPDGTVELPDALKKKDSTSNRPQLDDSPEDNLL